MPVFGITFAPILKLKAGSTSVRRLIIVSKAYVINGDYK
jgi:hypothetical protein